MPGWVPAGKRFMVVVTTFEAKADGTSYTARALHWSEADREAHESMEFHDGWDQSADRLAAVAWRLKMSDGR